MTATVQSLNCSYIAKPSVHFKWSHLEDVRVCGEPQQLAGLAQADAMQGGQIVTAREDAHVAKLLLCEDVPQGATAAQVTLIYLQTVALFVHFEDDLHGCER